MLMLLGLRWLPRAVAERRGAAALAHLRRRTRDLALSRGLRRRPAAALAWAMMTRPAPHQHLALLPRRTRCPLGGGTKRGQRDAGRLPRLRHPGRDHRAAASSRSPSTRCCAASARRARASSRLAQQRPCARRRTDLVTARTSADRCPGLPARAGRAGAAAAAAGVRSSRCSSSCAATTRRAAASSRGLRGGHRRSSCSTWSAARTWVEARMRLRPAALDRRRPAVRPRHRRSASLVVRLPVPHQRTPRTCTCRCIGEVHLAERAVLRHRRVPAVVSASTLLMPHRASRHQSVAHDATREAEAARPLARRGRPR